MLGRSLWVQRGVVLCVSWFPGPLLPLMPVVAFCVSKQRGRFDRFYLSGVSVSCHGTEGRFMEGCAQPFLFTNFAFYQSRVFQMTSCMNADLWTFQAGKTYMKCSTKKSLEFLHWAPHHTAWCYKIPQTCVCVLEAIKYWSWRWEESENRNVLCTSSAHNAWRGPNMSIRKTDLADYGPLLVTGVRDLLLKCWNDNVIYMTATEVLMW